MKYSRAPFEEKVLLLLLLFKHHYFYPFKWKVSILIFTSIPFIRFETSVSKVFVREVNWGSEIGYRKEREHFCNLWPFISSSMSNSWWPHCIYKKIVSKVSKSGSILNHRWWWWWPLLSTSSLSSLTWTGLEIWFLVYERDISVDTSCSRSLIHWTELSLTSRMMNFCFVNIFSLTFQCLFLFLFFSMKTLFLTQIMIINRKSTFSIQKQVSEVRKKKNRDPK